MVFSGKMALFLALLAIVLPAACADTTPPAAPVIVTAPNENDVMVDLTLNTEEGNINTLVLDISSSDELLVLARRDTTVERSYFPVARSYDGNDWERSAGPASNAELSFACSGTTRTCSVDLQQVEPNFVYFITSYSHTLSDQETAARFLEMTTFGPTRELVNDLVTDTGTSLKSKFAQFVTDQIAAPVGSHREYFRKRLNQRMTETFNIGVSGPAPCEKNSRWRRFAFTEKDKILSASRKMEYKKVTTSDNTIIYTLSFMGHLRTVLTEPLRYYTNFRNSDDSVAVPVGEFNICHVESIEGSRRPPKGKISPPSFSLTIGGRCREIVGGNPSVNLHPEIQVSPLVNNASPFLDFMGLTQEELFEIDTEFGLGSVLLLNVGITQEDFPCNDAKDMIFDKLATKQSYLTPLPPVFAKLPNNQGWALYDQRLDLKDNTIENPLIDGGGTNVKRSVAHKGAPSSTICINAPPTVFNMESCKLSTEEDVCQVAPNNDYLRFEFTEENLNALFELNGRYLYVLRNLPHEIVSGTHPVCGNREKSRWVPVDGVSGETACRAVSDVSVTDDTHTAIASALYDSRDENLYLKEIMFKGTCDENDIEKVGFAVFVPEKETCYKNVNLDELNVYDLSMWNYKGAGLDSGIKKWIDTASLRFPRGHTSYRGRYGDIVWYHSLHYSMKYYGASTSRSKYPYTQDFGQKQGGTLVCGSPGEVASDPTLDDHFEVRGGSLENGYGFNQAQTVWTMQAVYSPDQLRQRMAFALSQIFVVDPNIITGQNYVAEPELFYYDIFVRNGLGNYFDVMREVSYSPRMAEMLSHIRNKSVQIGWYNHNRLNYPDENYARELMQLFTIGLVELNLDGSARRDPLGVPLKTYNSQDIISFARTWTGLDYNNRRGNMEDIPSPSMWDRLSPMKIIGVNWRDWFPKRGLSGKYIGDGKPLCADLPEKHFLKIGAQYRLLGGSSKPTMHNVHERGYDSWDNLGTKRFVLNPATSSLYPRLCAADSEGVCTFPGVVTLDTNLECDGVECNIDTVRQVQIAPGVHIYYEYIRLPCVHLEVYDQPKKLAAFRWAPFASMCGNPQIASATDACCGLNKDKWYDSVHDGDVNTIMGRACEYMGERVTYTTNIKRCEDLGGFTCNVRKRESKYPNKDCNAEQWGTQDMNTMNVWHWTNAPCSIKLAVQENGLVALVHDADQTHKFNTVKWLNVTTTQSWFSIYWERDEFGDDIYPNPANDCGGGTCEKVDEYTCLCDTNLEEAPAISEMPTREQVLTLSIGAFSPEIFDDGTYSLIGDAGGVQAYRRNEPVQLGHYSAETIFKVLSDDQKPVYRKNLRSRILLGNKSENQYDIRNMPNIFDLAEPTKRDAYYETDAVLEHLLDHHNTAPFVSKNLIQHFGISNPSPDYIRRVATAFQTGTFEYFDGVYTTSYGEGNRGDLAATAAAIILDKEATSVVLDADPTHGALKEPLVKVVGLMRSMEYRRNSYSKSSWQMLSEGLKTKIGQMVYEAPSVFSFFSPLYSPPGRLAGASLLSPEAQVLSTITTVGTTNGLFSLVNRGLTDCGSGFGPMMSFCDFTHGYLSYSQESDDANAAQVIHDLATLITSGRLSQANRELIKSTYTSVYQKEGKETALQVAQQLIVSSPEFHTTSLVRTTGEVRSPSVQSGNLDEQYKAIVYIYGFGGLDSFHMLAPFYTCDDLYQSYNKERGGARLTWMRKLDASSSKQPCNKFGLHMSLRAVAELYDEGKAIFFANTGHLSKPVSKHNWITETRGQLFSHFHMMKESEYVDSFRKKAGTGVLGRMLDILQLNNYSVNANGINGHAEMLNGDPSVPRGVDVIRSDGLDPFYPEKPSSTISTDDMKAAFRNLNAMSDINTGIYGDHWSQAFIDGEYRTAKIREALGDSTANTVYYYAGSAGNRLKMVSKLIRTREVRGVNRDAFHVHLHGFDTHREMVLSMNHLLEDLNRGLDAFVKEMRHINLFDQVTVVFASEFGRTIAMNTVSGTDHAWGGNYFMLGGAVNGGKIMGKYPESFDKLDATNDGRGRLVPTTSWDALWNGIAQWFGITDENELDFVLPNRQNFGCQLFTDKEMFVGGTQVIEGCQGKHSVLEQTLRLNETRYLKPEEQLEYCKALIKVIREKTPQIGKVRCTVIDQKVGRRLSNDAATYEMTVTTDLNTDAENENSFSVLASENATSNVLELLKENPDFALAVDNVTTVVPPSVAPSLAPATPSTTPSLSPSDSVAPSTTPSLSPSNSVAPSTTPSLSPSDSVAPSTIPSTAPSTTPSLSPSDSVAPSTTPSLSPSNIAPSTTPSLSPSESLAPSTTPSLSPSDSVAPSTTPSLSPSESLAPSSTPSLSPSDSVAPSTTPSLSPSESLAPSSTPKDSTPSTRPSLSPSESFAPSSLKDTSSRYDITERDIDIRFDETRANEEIILNYNISSKPYAATLYEYDCLSKVEVGQEILSYSYEETPGSSPPSYKNLAVKVNVHREKIQNVTNGVWVNGEPGFGKIRFCVRLDLMVSNEYPVSVNFHEQKIDITVDMRMGFEVTDITTDRDESTLENKTATVDLSINAYRCDEDDGPISSSPLSQGSPLRVCIVTSDTEYALTEVLDFELYQDGVYGSSVTPVTNGETNSLTESSCSGNKCVIKTMLVSSFFYLRNAPNKNVEGSGKVAFNFASESRRKLASGAKFQITSTDDTWKLQEGQDESSSLFRLTLQVQIPPNKEEVPTNTDISMAQASRDKGKLFGLMFIAMAIVSVLSFWFVFVRKKMKKNDEKEDIESDVILTEQKDIIYLKNSVGDLPK